MRKTFLAIATLASLGLWGGTAVADEPGEESNAAPPEAAAPEGGSAQGTPSAQNDFTTLDKDSDGSLTKTEAEKNKELAAQWDTLDANKDGKLDQAEFAKFETAPAAEPSTPSTTPAPSDKGPMGPGM